MTLVTSRLHVSFLLIVVNLQNTCYGYKISKLKKVYNDITDWIKITTKKNNTEVVIIHTIHVKPVN